MIVYQTRQKVHFAVRACFQIPVISSSTLERVSRAKAEGFYSFSFYFNQNSYLHSCKRNKFS